MRHEYRYLDRILKNISTVKPPIKDTPKEDKPPNKGQAESTLVYTLYRKSPLKEDNLSTKDKKRLVPKVSLLRGSTVLPYIQRMAGLQWYLTIKDTLGPAILSFIRGSTSDIKNILQLISAPFENSALRVREIYALENAVFCIVVYGAYKP